MLNLAICYRARPRTRCERNSKLSSIHEQKKASNKLVLLTRFHEYKMNSSNSIAQHIAKIENIANQIRDVGQEIPSVMIIAKILSTLPSKFNAFVSALENVDEANQTLEILQERLLREETRMTTTDDIANALATSSLSSEKKVTNKKIQRTANASSQDKGDKVCNYCGKNGHFARHCFKKKRDRKANQSSSENSENGKDSQHSAFVASEKFLSLSVNLPFSESDWFYRGDESDY